MGATLAGRQAGTFGLCGTFSSFFSHHISTMEGGMVVTDDRRLYDTMLSLRAHGWTRDLPADTHLPLDPDPFVRQFRFVLPGYNLRPLELEGAVGIPQLAKLPGFIAATMSSVQSFGAGRPGISAVVMTISMSGASSRNLASCFSRNSGLDGAA